MYPGELTSVRTYPMFSPRPAGFGADGGTVRMTRLRLHNSDSTASDSIPFPRPVSRIGRWDPKPDSPRMAPLELADTGELAREVERVVDEMDRKLQGLRQLLGPDLGDDGGPKAA